MTSRMKAIAIKDDEHKIRDMFHLAKVAQEAAGKILSKTPFRIMPMATWNNKYQCYTVLVEYDPDDREQRTFEDVAPALNPEILVTVL